MCDGSVSNACRTCRNGWEWMDGKSYRFQNWEDEKPSSTGRSCARLFNNGQWRDNACGAGFKYICKKIGKQCDNP